MTNMREKFGEIMANMIEKMERVQIHLNPLSYQLEPWFILG
jgi:hypothetical protein